MDSAGSKLLIVCFLNSWCEPCQRIRPIFDNLSTKYSSAMFVSVDAEIVTDSEEVKNLIGVPTFKFWKNGNLITQFSGPDVEKLQNTIEENV